MDDLLQYFNALLGDTKGWLITATGSGPHLENGRYAHQQWSERAWRWPSNGKAAAEAMLEAAQTADVYVCPYLMKSRERTKGNAVCRELVHADVDCELEPAEVEALGGFAVSSGSPGHGHVFVGLDYAVTAAQHSLLCRALGERLGGDAKISDNDLLRVPRTFNHKSAAAGGDPTPVDWLVQWDGTRVDPRVLATVLEVDIAHAEREPSSATAHDWHSMAFTPFPLQDYPTVTAALADSSGDRSKDTIRILSTCFDAGLTLPQGRWALQQRADLKARLEEFATRTHPVDDAAVCWSKIAPGLEVPKTTPNGQVTAVTSEVRPEASESRTLVDTLEVFRRWLYLDDPTAVLVVAATVVANLAAGDPVWTLLVGPPSGGKTEILASLIGLDYIVPAATVTEAALLSGTAKRERTEGATGGLLRQVGEFGILLAKDFTSVLSQNADTASAAMAALREVYDGRWDRPVGTDGGKVLIWRGKCGFVGGVTPSYDRYTNIVSALGARFLLLRLPRPNRAKQSVSALRAAQHERRMRAELAEAMHTLIAGAALESVSAPLDETEEARLSDLAEFTSTARTAVERDRTGELLVLPEPEGPARIVKALRQLYGGLAALGADRNTQWSALTRVALDSLPAIRVPLARTLLRAEAWRRTANLAEDARLSTKTAGRHLENLMLLGAAERTKRRPTDDPEDPDDVPEARDNSPFHWRATDWLEQYWPEKVGLQPTRECKGDAPAL